jgi:uroporphyrinogen-III synthase
MSLSGITVAITSSRRASELASLVRKFGGVPYIAPTIGIRSNNNTLSSECTKFIEIIESEKMHFFVFMTGVGVFNLFQCVLKSNRLDNVIEKLHDTIIIARSNKPALELRKFGIPTKFVPKMNTIGGIIDLISKFDVKDKNVGILWHGDYADAFKKRLESLGSKVFEFSLYSYSTNLEQKNASMLKEMGYDYVAPTDEKIKGLIDDIVAGNIDTITFTSPPAVKEFFEFASRNNKIDLLIDKLNHNVLVVSVGPSTSAMIEKFRIKVDLVPHAYRMGTMVKELADYISSHE